MRRTDARRRERDTPEGVTQGFHVSVYKVDPSIDSRARNLFSKDDWRAADFDEMIEGRPEVPLVSKRSSFACRAERLARTGTGPNRSVVRPSSASKRVAPDADSCEEMALGVSAQVVWSNIFYAPGVYVARRNVALADQFAQPFGRL
jgi:hypothetical protein